MVTQLIFSATSACNSPPSLPLTPTISWRHTLHYSEITEPSHNPLHADLHICYILCCYVFLYPVHLTKDQLAVLFHSFLYSFAKILPGQGKCKTAWLDVLGYGLEIDPNRKCSGITGNIEISDIPMFMKSKCGIQSFMGHLHRYIFFGANTQMLKKKISLVLLLPFPSKTELHYLIFS